MAKNRDDAWQNLLMLVAYCVPFLALDYDHARGPHAALYCLINALLLPVIALSVALFQVAVASATAKALGERPLFARLGLGPQLFGFTLGMFFVNVHPVILNAQTISMTTRSRGQLARAIIPIVASIGALAALTTFILQCTSGGLWHRYTTRVSPDASVVLVASTLATMSLFELASLVTGPQFLAARLRLGVTIAAELQVLHGGYDKAIALVRNALEQTPDDILLQFALVNARVQSGEDCIEELEKLLERDLLPLYRARVQNMIAWRHYKKSDDAGRSRADELSAEALTFNSKHPSYLDTRGHVLLWLGRTSEAEAHLKEAYELTKDPGVRAASAAGLAIIASRRDRVDEARKWLAVAKEGKNQWLIARAIAAVDPLHRV